MNEILPIIEVQDLPEEGEFNVCYRVPDVFDGFTEYVWNGTRFRALIFDMETMDAVFNSLLEYINELEARVEALEGGGLLYEGDNITCEEAGASIGTILDITADKTVYDGSIVKITMTDMTIDGEPIDDVEDTITLGGIGDWNWQGGEVYADVFSPAYFTFGTKPLNAIPKQATFGFTNEQEHFDVRTLVIGHIKVEIVGRSEVA